MPPSADPPVWLSGAILTFLNKMVFPTVWCSALVGILTAMIARSGHIVVVRGWGFIYLFTITVSVGLLWLSSRLESVGYQGRELLLANYWRSARIPFEDVAAVEPVWWYKGRLVRVRFRSPTPFGSSVYYLPKWGPIRCLFSSPHKELSEIIWPAGAPEWNSS